MNKWTVGALVAAVLVLIVIGYRGCSATTVVKQNVPAPVKIAVPEDPEIVAARAMVALQDNSRKASEIRNAGIAQEIPCGSIVKSGYDPALGTARFWFERVPEDTPLRCFNAPGYSRTRKGKSLEEGTDAVIDEILLKKDYYPDFGAAYTRPAVTSTLRPAAPAPSPTAVPELGGSPGCCSTP